MRNKNLDVESSFDRLMQYRKLNLDHKLYEEDFERGCRL